MQSTCNVVTGRNINTLTEITSFIPTSFVPDILSYTSRKFESSFFYLYLMDNSNLFFNKIYIFPFSKI